jgi:hypothetical protein
MVQTSITREESRGGEPVTELRSGVFKIRSYTDPDTHYTVGRGFCGCPAHKFGKDGEGCFGGKYPVLARNCLEVSRRHWTKLWFLSKEIYRKDSRNETPAQARALYCKARSLQGIASEELIAAAEERHERVKANFMDRELWRAS